MHSKNLLRSVSRSFSLSLLSLPESKRDFVSTTYLVARIADTFADSGNWLPDQRLAHLEAWEKALFNPKSPSWKLESSVGSFASEEAQLLLESPRVLKGFRESDSADQAIAEELFKVLFQGMRWAIRIFSGGSQESPVFACKTRLEFDFYCYAHAGCVGAFWTKIFGLPEDLENFSVQYGKALERINILRDLVEDRKAGRILLAQEDLTRFSLVSDEPWLEEAWPRFLEEYIRETREMLLQGAFFCDSIPRWQWRLRWASMMPLKIGLKCLDLYATESRKTGTTKIDRKEVYRLAWRSLCDVALGRKISKKKCFKEAA